MSGLYGDNKAAQISVTLALSILVLADVIGNSLVIHIILTHKSLRSPMIFLLLNLAVADITVGIFFSPYYIFSNFFSQPDGLAGTLMCKVLTGGGLAWVGGTCSAATLVAISFERYFAIMHPHSRKYKLSVKKVKRVVTGCWVLAFLVITPFFVSMDVDEKLHICMQNWSKPWFGRAYSIFCLFCLGIIPISTMFVLYSRVVFTLWFKQQQEGTQLAMLKSRKRVTKMVVIVSVIYAVCWLPDLIIYLHYHFSGIIEHSYSVDVPSILAIILVTCNSSINPFIYTFQSNVFRRHFIELVSCRKLRKEITKHLGSEGDSINTTTKKARITTTAETTNSVENAV